MRYLLDTHTFLWMAADPAKLSAKIIRIVQASDNHLLLSAASGWEIALLWYLKRVELPDHPRRGAKTQCNRQNFKLIAHLC